MKTINKYERIKFCRRNIFSIIRVSVHETNRRQLWTDGIAGTLNDETNNKNLIKFHFKF